MRKKSANQAWLTIRKNQAIAKNYGLSYGIVTQKSIADYLKNNPKTTIFVSELLANCEHSIYFLMKKTGKSRKTVVSFLLGALESIIQKKPMIGKKLVTPALQLYSKGGVQQTKEVGEKKGSAFYKTETKEKVHNAIIEAMLQSSAPKEGIIATLPYHFGLEKKIITYEELNGLNLQGYEGAYNITKSRESRLTHKHQRSILRSNPALASRTSIAFANINDILCIEKPNRYAYIFADYCGTFKSNQKAVKHVIENNVLVRYGFMWVTFSTRHGFSDNELKKLVEKSGRGNYKFIPIEGKEIYHYAECGAMVTALIQRVK